MMDVWCLQLQLCAVSCLLLHGGVSLEVTVRHSELQQCEGNKPVCVTDPRDCSPRPPSSVQETLNMSCYYQRSADQVRSMTCAWSLESDSLTDASLIFSSKRVYSCRGIFNPAAVLNVTARIRNYLTGTETWSQPHTVVLRKAVKPPQPLLSVLSSTEDSVVVSWRSSANGSCRLRYRLSGSQMWIQAADSVPAHKDQELTQRIQGLQPFTVYSAAVACRGASSIWSDWSLGVSGRTQDRAPSRPPQVCYRAERTGSGDVPLLHLIWKTSDPVEAGARILGYQVSCESTGVTQNVTETTALLVEEEKNCSVAVRSFNTAGCGPAARLTIDPQRMDAPPSVRNLWVSSFYPGNKSLLVQWEASTLPVSHFVVQWRSETSSSTLRWSSVITSITSAVIQDVDPDESYLISVFPVHQQQCGPPESLPASLQHGALMEAVSLNVIHVTKTTVTAVCVWRRTSGPIRVSRYRAMLRRHSDGRGGPALTLYPDQSQHTFLNLTPNAQYSLLLLADNISRSIVPVVTSFDEVPVVATATPLLLLAVVVLIIAILSRTVYKSYFFPPISSPRGSTSGRWLMDPNLEKGAEGTNILVVEDLQVTEVLVKKSLIMVDPKPPIEHGDTPSISRLLIRLDADYVSAAASEQQEASSLQARRSDDEVFIPEMEESRDVALLPHIEEEEDRQGDVPQMANHTEPSVRCGGQVTCEAVYVRFSFVGERDAETERTRLMCEPEYLPNTEPTRSDQLTDSC
ncbi:interleukin-6 receptor subunit beta [Parambassis ranga]|uniref:Interleukin-6 receptor subunit beta n=1 Tax=Parambassis ranga TaxID=210632 RepID=A0A6P7IZL9_9TELE|nr:interleukin-6 receptor subunit beta-like [Parambassis ranga]